MPVPWLAAAVAASGAPNRHGLAEPLPLRRRSSTGSASPYRFAARVGGEGPGASGVGGGAGQPTPAVLRSIGCIARVASVMLPDSEGYTANTRESWSTVSRRSAAMAIG